MLAKNLYSRWQTGLHAKTEEEFEKLWGLMQLKDEEHIVPMDYLEHEVIYLHKTKIRGGNEEIHPKTIVSPRNVSTPACWLTTQRLRATRGV